MNDDTVFSSIVEPTVTPLPPLPIDNVSLCLNDKQKMVHHIVTSHLRAFLSDANPPQHLMIVHGQGSTGKTTLLNAIAKTFEALGASSLW